MLPMVWALGHSFDKPIHSNSQPGGKLVCEGIAPSTQYDAGRRQNRRRRWGQEVGIMGRHLLKPGRQEREHVSRAARHVPSLRPLGVGRRGRYLGPERDRDRAWPAGQV